MTSLFFKRLCAYMFDVFIVTLIISIITIKFNGSDNAVDKMYEALNSVNNQEISVEEYTNELFEINYGYQKSILPNSIVGIVINVGYFIVFAYLNKGQTLGKKIFNISVLCDNDKNPSIFNMFGRSILLYGILSGIINIVCILFFDVNLFNYISTFVNYGYYIFVIICFFMTMYKKDGRGLHDMIGRTYVKEKVK